MAIEGSSIGLYLEALYLENTSLRFAPFNNMEISRGSPGRLNISMGKSAQSNPRNHGNISMRKRSLVIPIRSRCDELELGIEKVLIEFFVFVVHCCEYSAGGLWSYSIDGLGNDGASSV